MGESLRSILGNGNGRGPRRRCVVLVARGLPGPDRLLEGLQKRGADVQVVPDPPSVMVELARGAKVVIVHEPRRVRRLPELMAALRRYYPQATCWQFDPVDGNGQGKLAPLDAPPTTAETPTAGPPGEETPAAAAQEAAGAPAEHLPADATLPDDPAPPLITAEELAMLLETMPDATQTVSAERSAAGEVP